jgi:hypothetical protein
VQICVCSAGSATRVILGFFSAEPEASGLLRVLLTVNTVLACSQKVKNARRENRSLSVRPVR